MYGGYCRLLTKFLSGSKRQGPKPQKRGKNQNRPDYGRSGKTGQCGIIANIWVSCAIFQRYVQICRLGQPYEAAQSEIQITKKSFGFGAQIQTTFWKSGFKIQILAPNLV